MKQADFDLRYNNICYVFLNEYLLYTNDINNALNKAKELVTNEYYIGILSAHIKGYKNGFGIPLDAINNIKVIIKFLKSNTKGLEKEILNCENELNTIDNISNDAYYHDFLSRFISIEPFVENKNFVWSKKDMIEQIAYDFAVVESFNVPADKYIENYLMEFLLNKRYLNSIKRLISLYPELFISKEINDRVVEMLNVNIETLKDMDDETIKLYICQNYNKKITKLNQEEIEEFINENKVVKDKIEKANLNKCSFNAFQNYFDLLKLEQVLYFDIDVNNINIETIYNYIDYNLDTPTLTIQAKNKLLDIMNNKKLELEPIYKAKYNDYLVKLNMIEPSNHNLSECSLRANYFESLKIIIELIRGKNDTYLKIIDTQEYDLLNFTSFILENEDFDESKFLETDYEYSITKFLNEAPFIFEDDNNKKRAISILKKFNNLKSKQLIKTLSKKV